jgi:hypothetical protein
VFVYFSVGGYKPQATCCKPQAKVVYILQLAACSLQHVACSLQLAALLSKLKGVFKLIILPLRHLEVEIQGHQEILQAVLVFDGSVSVAL